MFVPNELLLYLFLHLLFFLLLFFESLVNLPLPFYLVEFLCFFQMLQLLVDFFGLFLYFLQILNNLLIGLFELLQPLVLGLGLSLHFELMIDGNLLHKWEIQILYHRHEFIVQGTLPNDMNHKAFYLIKLFLKIVLFLFTKSIGTTILNIQQLVFQFASDIFCLDIVLKSHLWLVQQG